MKLQARRDFDFDALQKDAWIEAEEMERILGCKRTEKNFLLRVLALRAEIEKKTGILSRIQNDKLRLMTDSEAVQWIAKQTVVAIDSLGTCSRRAAAVDKAALNDGERRAAEYLCLATSHIAQAARKEAAKYARFRRLYGDDETDAEQEKIAS